MRFHICLLIELLAVQGLQFPRVTVPRSRSAVLCASPAEAAKPAEAEVAATAGRDGVVVATNELLMKARDSKTVLKVVAEGGSTLNGINIATAMHCLAKINKRNRVGRDALLRDRGYTSLIDSVVAQASELSPRATADVLWSCATLQDFPPQLLMPVLTSVAGHLDKEAFAPRHLASVVWSLARLTTKPTRLLERIEEQAIPRLDGMNDQNIANLLWGFAKLNYKPSKLLPAASEALLKPGMVERAKHVEVSDLAFAFGELGAPGDYDALMLALSERVAPGSDALDRFTSRQLVKLIAAFAKLEAAAQLPSGRLETWVEAVRVGHGQTSLMARDQRTLEEALGKLDIDASWIKEFEMIGTWSALAAGGKAKRREYTDDELRAVFDAIDADGSGDIDLGELKVAINKMSADGGEATDADVKNMLNFGDTDGDAQVSFDEFRQIMNGAVAKGKRVMIA